VKLPKEIHILSKDGRTLIERVEIAQGFGSRLKGLLGQDQLGMERALCILPCSCIHTFGMRFAIDAIFLSRKNEITRLVWDLSPGRVAFGGWRAHMVLEMQSGWFPRDVLRKGDVVRLTQVKA
jgi:uncharacterized membrane protein (UPF0127 family)